MNEAIPEGAEPARRRGGGVEAYCLPQQDVLGQERHAGTRGDRGGLSKAEHGGREVRGRQPSRSGIGSTQFLRRPGEPGFHEFPGKIGRRLRTERAVARWLAVDRRAQAPILSLGSLAMASVMAG